MFKKPPNNELWCYVIGWVAGGFGLAIAQKVTSESLWWLVPLTLLYWVGNRIANMMYQNRLLETHARHAFRRMIAQCLTTGKTVTGQQQPDGTWTYTEQTDELA